MGQFKRSQRVQSQMLRDVRELLDQEIAYNLKIMVTFTDVELSNDLRYAKIFYSVLGDQDKKTRAERYLNKIRNRVQNQLGRMLRIKTIPEIEFKFDPSIERGMRIEQLLNEISRKHDSGKDENIS